MTTLLVVAVELLQTLFMVGTVFFRVYANADAREAKVTAASLPDYAKSRTLVKRSGPALSVGGCR